jgi:hypothetical protein
MNAEDIANLESGIWNLESGIWNLESESESESEFGIRLPAEYRDLLSDTLSLATPKN